MKKLSQISLNDFLKVLGYCSVEEYLTKTVGSASSGLYSVGDIVLILKGIAASRGYLLDERSGDTVFEEVKYALQHSIKGVRSVANKYTSTEGYVAWLLKQVVSVNSPQK